MRVQLVDVDSKIPNLALMKVSAYHKAQGHTVGFDVVDPDLVYASVIFKKNKHKIDGLKFFYPGAQIIVGGSGYDLHSKLPDDIERMMPDYSLYSECDYSMGFSTRGCFRNCYFCIVPEKEGSFHKVAHPQEWHNPTFDKIMFLDNNILADKEWFFEVTQWCIDHGLKVWFTQGLDIRLLDEQIAARLYKMKVWKPIFFAWDHIQDEPIIKAKIRVLNKVGFTPSKLKRWVQFYVYVGSDADYETGVYRCRTLKELNCNPFVMFNIDEKPTKRIQELRRWANLKWCFWACDISEYSRTIA
ncbi:hypothetical protein [Methanolobus chelungpuianus]|uniref:hypothetical protein n=1 Tax=Methanolobus chelungpuianus TaxID=502115 RepID=UPI00211535B3|nr:hypothetical protein [Methanolobus chelungpuianus]